MIPLSIIMVYTLILVYFINIILCGRHKNGGFMSKLKWFIIGAMMVTVMAVLVGCGAKNDSESGSNSGSGNNNKSTVENLMTEAATGAKEMMTEAATGAKEMMSTAENGMKEIATEISSAFHE